MQFIIVRDQDGADCVEVKKRLVEICRKAGRGDSLVRIVCNELESWFLGDLTAVAEAYDKESVKRLLRKQKYRNPDRVTNAAEEMKKIIPEYQKIEGARNIAGYLNSDRNRSNSFLIFIEGVKKLAGVMDKDGR